MANSTRNWLYRPTKKHVLLITIVWLMAMGLMILAMTQVFEQRIISRSNAGFLFLMFTSSLVVVGVYLNYLRAKHEG
ncbi:hypothetical protein [Sabulibacter ruber]|uniref:hypothetical protein n=1 Tax=Sabulibacter ruber TaxID=2811901 RepID=UPI001A95AD2F|nr:hypothetical protein [Sabulibacter ruber]